MRVNFKKLFIAAKDDKNKRIELLRKINKRIHFTLDREKIHWYPVINYSKCTSCGKCIKFCPKGVYFLNEKNKKIEVKNLSKCVFLCKGCESVCKEKAISFPKRSDMLDYFYYE
ncbi:ferredoxin family protein [Clostridium tetanomorphum]|uniref:Ferredoxin family protein n=2 Tax=Clostridium tetanomorphum TaxID=1553 RepID=A0A923EB79_CLOTT|nr:ferredoxin family protein [Clostridium tetanomorphum]